MSSISRTDWQCEYQFVREWDGGDRRCFRVGSVEFYGRFVCSQHVQYMLTEVFACEQCGALRSPWKMQRWIPRQQICLECAKQWPEGTRQFARCRYCGAPITDQRYPLNCYQRHCKVMGEFWHGFNHCLMHPRLSKRWDGMGKLTSLCEIAEFLRRMAHPKSPRELEFSKRYAHMRESCARGNYRALANS